MRGVALLTLLALASSLKDTSDCEVCLKVLGEIEAKLPSKSDLVATEKAIDAHCKKPPSVCSKVSRTVEFEGFFSIELHWLGIE